MDLTEVLAVLLGWIGFEVEVGTHGANGSDPVTALDARGTLRRERNSAVMTGAPAVFAFRIEGREGSEVASLRLYESSYVGGGWFDDAEEVLEIRSGVIRILVATVLDPDPADAR